jgi:hypothetical protein
MSSFIVSMILDLKRMSMVSWKKRKTRKMIYTIEP